MGEAEHGKGRGWGASMAGEPPTLYPATKIQSPRTAHPMPLHRTEGKSEKEKTKLPLRGKQNHERNHRTTLPIPHCTGTPRTISPRQPGPGRSRPTHQ
jgi:hypothetical protein